MDLGIIAIIISGIAVLLTLFRDFILPSIFGPRLELEGRDDGECVTNAIVTPGGDSRWIRLRLINGDGWRSRKAKNCYLKLLEIKDNHGKKILPFDQAPLKWVTYDNTKNNLSKGESHLIDLVHEFDIKSHRYLSFDFSLQISLLKEIDKKLGPGKYVFKIGVYGDNFNSFEKSFGIRLTNNFGELNFVK